MEQQINQMRQEFNRLIKEMDDLYREVARVLGLSDSAFDILFALYELGDGCLQKDICTLSFSSKQTINSSIRNLERNGLLYLKAGRGRNMHIILTESGRKLLEEKIAPAAELERETMEALSCEERRELLALTRKYTACFRDKVSEWKKCDS